MNAWDIDPNLYASLWKLVHEWFAQRVLHKPSTKARADFGCHA